MSTENKLTREEIIHVFHLYHNTDTMALGATFYKKDFIGKIDAVMNHLISLKYEDEGEYRRGLMWPVEGCRLLLTPLSGITDEHAIEVARLHYSMYATIKLPPEAFITTQAIHMGKVAARNSELSAVFQYLIQQGYAVPLWFGIDHWANGQTAIALNIAKDVTEK